VSVSVQWEKLPIRLRVDSILVWRGKPRTAQERYASQLTSALALYRDDKFAEAADRLTKVASDFPRGVEGQLYLGVSLLKMDRNAEAIVPLQDAQKLGPEQFSDDATWYLAKAYARTGNRVGAVVELKKLCKGKSLYAPRACTAAP
jgi:predicted Zn-dependent protease